jgi:hypothetical protein
LTSENLCLREDAARLSVHRLEADWALAVVHGLVRRCVGLPEAARGRQSHATHMSSAIATRKYEAEMHGRQVANGTHRWGNVAFVRAAGHAHGVVVAGGWSAGHANPRIESSNFLKFMDVANSFLQMPA